MIELVYYSFSEKEISSKIIDDILKTAHYFNSKKNITGCLLYHNKIFLQILEGDKKNVLNLFESIKNDSRHNNVTLIKTENVSHRMFPGFSMAFVELNNNEHKMTQFIKNIDFYTNNNDLQTDAIDIFLRMAKQIVVK